MLLSPLNLFTIFFVIVYIRVGLLVLVLESRYILCVSIHVCSDGFTGVKVCHRQLPLWPGGLAILQLLRQPTMQIRNNCHLLPVDRIDNLCTAKAVTR